jgi:hypothetical protein
MDSNNDTNTSIQVRDEDGNKSLKLVIEVSILLRSDFAEAHREDGGTQGVCEEHPLDVVS